MHGYGCSEMDNSYKRRLEREASARGTRRKRDVRNDPTG